MNHSTYSWPIFNNTHLVVLARGLQFRIILGDPYDIIFLLYERKAFLRTICQYSKALLQAKSVNIIVITYNVHRTTQRMKRGVQQVGSSKFKESVRNNKKIKQIKYTVVKTQYPTIGSSVYILWGKTLTVDQPVTRGLTRIRSQGLRDKP